MENHGQKRTASEQNDVLENVNNILLDVEGVTTPISFVQEKLFVYVQDHVKSYIETHWAEDELQEDIQALRQQATDDKSAEMEGVVEIPEEDNQEAIVTAVANNVIWQMDNNRKTNALKQLQGHMWREAYKVDKVEGQVFGDVARALKEWKTQGKPVYVFSSGSVEAQKLLFGYSTQGDLTEYFAGHFDTAVGSKTEKASYEKIAEETGAKPEETIFLTDLPAEAAAAGEAGYKTCLVVREGNADLTDEDRQKFNTISSLGELLPDAVIDGEAPAKRQEAEEEAGEVEEEEEEDDVEDVEAVDEEEEEVEPEGEGEAEAAEGAAEES